MLINKLLLPDPKVPSCALLCDAGAETCKPHLPFATGALEEGALAPFSLPEFPASPSSDLNQFPVLILSVKLTRVVFISLPDI